MSSEFDRRKFLGLLATAAASAALPWSSVMAADSGLALGQAAAFSWEGLIEEARRLSKQPYQPELQPNQDILEQIDWEAHGKIHFKPDDALFASGPGQYPVQFFHPGCFFQNAVRMYRLDSSLSEKQTHTLAREILFDKQLFRNA